MYSEENVPTLTPMLPMASMSIGPYVNPLTSFASVSSLAQPMVRVPCNGSATVSGSGSGSKSNGFGSPESDISNISSSPVRDFSETSSSSSTEYSNVKTGTSSKTKERKRKGLFFNCKKVFPTI